MTETTTSSGQPLDNKQLKAIEAQLARMTKVFMDGADPIVIRDFDGYVLDMNYETERVFGWPRDEIIGQQTRHLLPEKWHEQADEVLERTRRGEIIRNYEGEVRAKSGHVVPVLVTTFVLGDENGQPMAVAAIAKDITRLKQTTEKLERRNREIKQFVDAVSHDLGAPLRSIRGFAELLYESCGDSLDNESAELLQYIIDNSSRMQEMVQDLLDYAQLDAKKGLPTEPVNLPDVLKEVTANLQWAIDESEAQIDCDSLPTVNGNKTLLTLLLQNLIENAIKFCSTTPVRIHISARQIDDGDWQVSVSDNGLGIEAKNFDKIFEAFQRVNSIDAFPGSGLGLATCKAVVEHHGGTIWVDGKKGEGSSFHFTLPGVSQDKVCD